jgi:hypothetical protein
MSKINTIIFFGCLSFTLLYPSWISAQDSCPVSKAWAIEQARAFDEDVYLSPVICNRKFQKYMEAVYGMEKFMWDDG